MGPRGSLGPHQKVIQHTMGMADVKLHQTDNKWKPTAKIEKPAEPEEAKTEVRKYMWKVVTKDL